MYLEQADNNRSGWKFTYLGGELLEAAKRKHKESMQEEQRARENVAALLRDSRVTTSDERINTEKRKIESFGRQREQCAVFIHEFERKPEREFHLTIGDVVFFGLAPLANLEDAPEEEQT